VYDDIKTIADHRHYLGDTPHGGNNRSDSAGGGHAHCGALIYLGERSPKEYRDTILFDNIHGNRINNDLLERQGLGLRRRARRRTSCSRTTAGSAASPSPGPTASVYFIDWYDKQACHWTEAGDLGSHERAALPRAPRQARREDGRPAPALRRGAPASSSLPRTTGTCATRGGCSPSARRARDSPQHRAGMPRRPRAIRGASCARCGPPTARRAVDTELALEMLGSPHEYVVAWTVQLLLETAKLPAASDQRALGELARATKSPVVRLYLERAATAAPRAIALDRWRARANTARTPSDHNLPLMIWYGIEPLVPADPKRALALAEKSEIPLIANFVVRRAANEPACQDELVSAIARRTDREQRTVMIAELAEVLRVKRGLAVPKNWPALYAELAADSDPAVRDRALAIAVAYGDSTAFGALRGVLSDASAPRAQREKAFDVLLGAKDRELAPHLIRLLDDDGLRGRALKALSTYDDPATAKAVLARYATLDQTEKRDALNTLSSRPSWALELLGALGRGELPRADLGAFVLQNLRNLKDANVDELVARDFGLVRDTPEEKKKRIEELKGLISSEKLASASKPRGREVFSRTCQQCHTLFGTGGTLAPDLTGSNRADLDYLLSNVVDPSAVVGKEYQATIVELATGQILTGIVKKNDADGVVLATENDVLHLAHDEIETLRLTENSTMPEGLLDPLSPDEVVDLVAYLASPGQTRILATPANAKLFFDGATLAHWTGDTNVWSVVDGELVGKTAGLDHNAFLLSDFELGDFKLALEVRLVNDEGNSGVQFRTEPLGENGGGEVKGYQADIGPGWWGKLYEEGGRALLWEKSGEEHVVKDGWNRYEIEARGHHVKTWLNGKPCVDLEDPAGALSGIVALQVHSGGATEVRFRKFELSLD
jgi:putative heme-binding domain-containing protein